MSGGSLGYLYATLNDKLFQGELSPHYSNLEDGEEDKLDIQMARSLNPMRDKELSEMMYDVCNLVYALEWYKSGDIGGYTYYDIANNFKKKWLNRSNSDMLESYKNDLADYYKSLLKELDNLQINKEED